MRRQAQERIRRIAYAVCGLCLGFSLFGLLTETVSPNVGIPVTMLAIAAGAVATRELDGPRR